MESLTIVSLILALLCTKKKYRSLMNPSILFPIIWTFIFVLGKLRFFRLYEASDTAIACIQLGTLSFTLGSLLWSAIRNHFSFKSSHWLVYDDRNLNYNVLYAVAGVCIVYFLPQMFRSLAVILSGGGLHSIRGLIQNVDSSTGIMNFLYNFIILPAAIVIELIGPLDYWFGKRNKILFGLSLVLVLIRVLADAGRTPLFNFLIYMILGYVCTRNKSRYLSKEEKRRKKAFRWVALFAVVFLGLTSLSRAGSSIWRIAYFYFAMPNVLLTRWIEIVDSSKFISYGITSLNGLFYAISYLIKNIFRVDHFKLVIDSFNQIALTDSTWFKINGQTTTANAYVSMFWFMYADGRLFGVLLGSFLYGLYMNILYRNLVSNRSQRNAAIYFLAFQGMVFTFIRFPYAKTYYWIAFLALRFLIYRGNPRKRLRLEKA